MKAAAALYTLASAAVLTLMVMRPPVEVSMPTAAKAPPAAVFAPPPANTATPTATPTPPFPAKPAPDANAKPDYEREQRMADEIKGSIAGGEITTLNDGNHDFMGIFTPAEQPRGAVIVLHGCGKHPDWADVAHPLRVGLAEKGWATLSLQMPALDNNAKYFDYVPLFANADKRIDAGIAFLKQKGIAPIVLAAHSCGAHMAMDWIDNKGDGEIVAYIGLGMGATDTDQDLIKPFPLDKMKVPILDVYGEKEHTQVINTAPERLAMIQKAANPQSKQMVLPEANHDFMGKGSELTAVVVNWLNSLPL
jgi:dienelactone hydrolase